MGDANPEKWLAEILCRMHRPGSELLPVTHARIGYVQKDPFGGETEALGPAITLLQAKSQGYDIPDFVKAIEGAVLHENQIIKERHARAHGRLELAHRAIRRLSFDDTDINYIIRGAIDAYLDKKKLSLGQTDRIAMAFTIKSAVAMYLREQRKVVENNEAIEAQAEAESAAKAPAT